MLTVMKHRAIAGTEPVEHQRYGTDVDHSRPGCCLALLVLAVPTVPARPGVRPLHHPALRQRRTAWCALWTRRALAAPPGTMLRPPGVQSVVGSLRIRQDRHATRQGVGRDVAEQAWGGHPSIATGTGQEDGAQHPPRLTPEMPLAPCDFLASVLPMRGATPLRGLDRWALAADGARRGRASCGHAGLRTQGLAQVGPCPVVAPLGTIVIDGALGQPSMASLPYGHRTRAPSPVALLGGRAQRRQYRPGLVRQISRGFLSLPYAVNPSRALLC
jgi:hypothetical protein